MTTETQVMEVTTQSILDPKSALGRMLEKLGRIDYKVKPEQIADLKTRAESVIQSGKADKDASKLANTIRLEARRHRLDVQNDFKLAKETVKEIVQEISAKTNERGEILIASLEEIEEPLKKIEETFEANKKAEEDRAEEARKEKVRLRIADLQKVKAQFDFVAVQVMSDESYADLLTKSTHAFEQSEAARIEREEADRKVEEARQAKATIGRSRAGEFAQLGEIVAPEVAAEWDEVMYSIHRDEATARHQAREAQTKELQEREARLKDRAKQLTAYDVRPDLDFLATCSEDEFAVILDGAKVVHAEALAQKEQDEQVAAARRAVGKIRADCLAPYGGGFSFETLAGMSDDEFDTIFEAKKAKHEKAMADKATADRLAKEKQETDRVAAEKKRQEEIDLARPDAEKILAFLLAVGNIPGPDLQSEAAMIIVSEFSDMLNELIKRTKAEVAKLIAE